MPPHANRTPYPNSITGTLLLIAIPILFFQLTFNLTSRWYGGSSAQQSCPVCPKHDPALSWKEVLEQSRQLDLGAASPRDEGTWSVDGADVVVRREEDRGMEVRVLVEGSEEEWRRSGVGKAERLWGVVTKFCGSGKCEVRWGAKRELNLDSVLSGQLVNGNGAISDESPWDALLENEFQLSFDKGRLSGVTVRLKPPDV